MKDLLEPDAGRKAENRQKCATKPSIKKNSILIFKFKIHFNKSNTAKTTKQILKFQVNLV